MDTETTTGSSRKRKRNTETYKVNVIKSARLKGEEYNSYSGHLKPAKTPGFACKCKARCLQSIGEDNCTDVFTKFYNIKTKDEQDLYLQGLIDVREVKQRRPRKAESQRTNSASFKYNILLGTQRKEVCFDAFLSIFSKTVKSVRRLRELKLLGKPPVDKRGQGISNSKSYDIKMMVREHIESFEVKESHYAGKTIFYLSSEINIRKMWRWFCEKNPDVTVSYYYYWEYFRKNFNYRFGRPQVDTCCTCEELNLKIKSPHLNDVARRTAVAELMVHKRKSKKFYKALEYENSNEGKQEKHVLSLAFDYMQNVSLPKVPVQELFYRRQLTVNIFCINNIKSKTSTIYVYHEGNGRKSPDEVCSFLADYFSEVPDNITEVRLFADNCSAQNKNQTLCRYLLSLTDSGRFDKIQQYFPVRGHSFLPCDRDFGVIKRRLKRYDRIYTVHEITEHIIQSSRPGKFTVKEIEACQIKEYKNWWKQYYKKSCISIESQNKPRDERVHFLISNLFHFVYTKEMKGYVRGITTINGISTHTFQMSLRANQNINHTQRCAYEAGKVPIKQCKMNDFKRLKQYVPEEHSELYHEILNWPVSD